MGLVVLVNGLPASGKSTWAPSLELGWALGTAASETMWTLLADARCGAALRARGAPTSVRWVAAGCAGRMPLGLGPVIRVDTTRAVDVAALAAEVSSRACDPPR